MFSVKENFKNFLNSNFHFNQKETSLKYKVNFINATIGFSGFMAFFIGLVRINYESYIIGIADIIYSFLAFLILYNMRKNKDNIYIFSYITIAILFIFIFTIFLFANYPSSISLLFLLVGASFFLTGNKGAIKLTLLAVFTMFFSFLVFNIPSHYQSYEIFLISVYITVFVLILNQYELQKKESMKKLKYLNENLEKLVNKRTKELEKEKQKVEKNNKKQSILIQDLLSVGISLTSQKNYEILLEGIMLVCKRFSHADAGTLYLLNEETKQLEFRIVHTDSLDIKMGGTGEELKWPALELYKDGKPNDSMVAVKCALELKLFNFEDVYDVKEFNFEGTKVFDSSTNYRTKSMLVIPMRNRQQELIGVLQLLNKKDKNNNILSFDKDDETLINTMASLGAVSIHNHQLVDNLENLLESFIKTIAVTLEEKSLYTEHHSLRVVALVDLISKEINEDKTVFKDINFSEDELKELNMAALLHDIGKIITPEAVMDKATRLETIFDRIESIAIKFEILRKDCYIKYLEDKDQENYNKSIQEINDDEEFIIRCNTIGYIKDSDIQKIKKIASKKLIIDEKEVTLLTEDELKNLTIQKGTLTQEERDIINNHVKVSYRMLKNLPFPKKYKDIPKIAGSHHKSVDGKNGYAADELMGEPLGFKEKILAISDVLEAITSPERPYKKPFTLNESFKIICDMAKENHLDKELIQFILDSKLYLKYANEYLDGSQIDEVDDFFNKP